MSVAVELICDIRGVAERQNFTTHVQSTETVAALRDRLPSELGLSPHTRLRIYNAQTGAEYAAGSQNVQDAGITEVPAVYVREVRGKRRRHGASSGSGDPLLKAEIERLTKENEGLREELRKLGKDVPPGRSLLSAGAQAMEEEEEDEDERVAPVLPATATKTAAVSDDAGDSGTVSIGGGGGGFALDLGGGGASSFAVSSSSPAQVGLSETTAPATASFAINLGGGGGNSGSGGVGTVTLNGGGSGGGDGGGVKIRF